MQGDSHDLIQLIPRKQLLLDLALSRYGSNEKPIGDSTFYRWAKKLGLSGSQTHYSGRESEVFHDYANQLRVEQLNRRPPNRRKRNGITISKGTRHKAANFYAVECIRIA